MTSVQMKGWVHTTESAVRAALVPKEHGRFSLQVNPQTSPSSGCVAGKNPMMTLCPACLTQGYMMSCHLLGLNASGPFFCAIRLPKRLQPTTHSAQQGARGCCQREYASHIGHYMKSTRVPRQGKSSETLASWTHRDRECC